jgi:hypothetical protein
LNPVNPLQGTKFIAGFKKAPGLIEGTGIRISSKTKNFTTEARRHGLKTKDFEPFLYCALYVPPERAKRVEWALGLKGVLLETLNLPVS